MTWERLRALMDNQYYPRDVQRTKEREFLGLKQGNWSVAEYTAKFNELSRFAPHQVNTEERKMDYFEQGLKGRFKGEYQINGSRSNLSEFPGDVLKSG